MGLMELCFRDKSDPESARAFVGSLCERFTKAHLSIRSAVFEGVPAKGGLLYAFIVRGQGGADPAFRTLNDLIGDAARESDHVVDARDNPRAAVFIIN